MHRNSKRKANPFTPPLTVYRWGLLVFLNFMCLFLPSWFFISHFICIINISMCHIKWNHHQHTCATHTHTQRVNSNELRDSKLFGDGRCSQCCTKALAHTYLTASFICNLRLNIKSTRFSFPLLLSFCLFSATFIYLFLCFFVRHFVLVALSVFFLLVSLVSVVSFIVVPSLARFCLSAVQWA